MKAFKFTIKDAVYAYAAETKELAIDKYMEEVGDKYILLEEIPEADWDEKEISTWEDNDFEKEPYRLSIREVIFGNDPQLIFTNDLSLF